MIDRYVNELVSPKSGMKVLNDMSLAKPLLQANQMPTIPTSGNEHFDDGAAIHDPIRLGNRLHRHNGDTHTKGELDGNSNPERTFDAPYRIDDTGKHASDACHPQRKS